MMAISALYVDNIAAAQNGSIGIFDWLKKKNMIGSLGLLVYNYSFYRQQEKNDSWHKDNSE